MRAPLVVGVAWLAAGLAAGLQRPVPSGGGPLFIALALAGATSALWLIRAPRGRRAVFALLCLAGALLGAAARTEADRSCARWIPDGDPIEVRGAVVHVGPEGGAGARALRVRVDSVGSGERWLPCGVELRARWDGEPLGSGVGPQLRAGHRVHGRGRWWSPPGAAGTFVRPGALLLDALRVVDPPGGRAAPRAGVAARVRDAGVRRIDGVFSRHPALVASLVLAQRDGLDRDVRDRYARAGLSHLLAISGLHVGLIAGILLLLTAALRLRKPHASALAAAGTVAYVALLGAPDSAARAALQIVLVLAARAVQRPTRTEALIAAAALVLLAADPASITRPGFQLSFAGVVGILALRRPILEALAPLSRVRVARRSVGRWLADGLATSLAATAATAPIVAWHFGRVAPIGIVANLVAIPLLGAALPALALALALGSVWLPAGRFVAGGGELLLDAVDRTATLAAAVPFGTVAVLPASAVALTAAVGLGYGASRRLGRVRGAVRGSVWVSVTVTVLALTPLRPTGDRVEIHLIDVGQGDAIGIRSPGGRWVLMDAGLARNDYDAGSSRVIPYLGARGVRRLEALLISHPDGDHMGGAGAVIRALRPRWAGGPGLVAGKPQYLALLLEARAAGVPWVAVRKGMEVELDGMTMTFLFPDRSDLGVDDANDASVVLRVAYGEFAVLLTGDAPASVEDRLVRELGRRLDADVLKVGHHGSNTSTTVGLLTATGARTAIISAGRDNRYGHPHHDVLARLRQQGLSVYRTDRHGSIVVRGDPDGRVRIRTERESERQSERERARSPG